MKNIIKKIITGIKTRWYHIHAIEPQTTNEGIQKYSVRVAIPKEDAKTVTAINEALYDVFEKFAPVDADGDPYQYEEITSPLKNGDEEYPGNPNYEGYYYIDAFSVRRPEIINAERQLIDDPEVIHDGVYGRVSLSLSMHSYNNKPYFSVWLNNLLYLADGDIVKADTTAEADFADFLT